MAPELPPEMPLTHREWGTDTSMRKQQRSYGITALALSKGLELMKEPLSQLTQLTGSLPDVVVVNHCFTSLFGTKGLLSDIVLR